MVTTNASGNAALSATLPIGGLAGQVISATATAASGDTSEFSKDVTATAMASRTASGSLLNADGAIDSIIAGSEFNRSGSKPADNVDCGAGCCLRKCWEHEGLNSRRRESVATIQQRAFASGSPPRLTIGKRRSGVRRVGGQATCPRTPRIGPCATASPRQVTICPQEHCPRDFRGVVEFAPLGPYQM